MALPSALLIAPSIAPHFFVEGHAIEEDSVYAQVPSTTGHSRSRRRWTVTERVVAVEWQLDPDEMAAVDDWYENTLEAGARQFPAKVRNQGTGDLLLWWTARWISFETEMMHLGRGHVRGSLLLVGEGTSTPPTIGYLTLEDASYLLLEDGGRFQLEV